jgi:hypothetical protein
VQRETESESELDCESEQVAVGIAGLGPASTQILPYLGDNPIAEVTVATDGRLSPLTSERVSEREPQPA